MELKKVTTLVETINTNQQSWKQPFNSVLFMNYDPNGSVKICGDITLPAAIQPVPGGPVYPVVLEIALNAGEINSRNFYFTFPNPGTGTEQLVISYTEYTD